MTHTDPRATYYSLLTTIAGREVNFHSYTSNRGRQHHSHYYHESYLNGRGTMFLSIIMTSHQRISHRDPHNGYSNLARSGTIARLTCDFTYRVSFSFLEKQQGFRHPQVSAITGCTAIARHDHVHHSNHDPHHDSPRESYE